MSSTGNATIGKSQAVLKDCEILEHCLALCRALRAAGFSGAAVFISSNKKDYLEATRLHPVLQADFASVGMEYAGDFAWALGELRRLQQLSP
jgi:hypothetical protein